MLGLVAEHRGSIAAEHGVGVAKTRWLPLSRSAEELAAMRAVKQAFDPGRPDEPGRDPAVGALTSAANGSRRLRWLK